SGRGVASGENLAEFGALNRDCEDLLGPLCQTARHQKENRGLVVRAKEGTQRHWTLGQPPQQPVRVNWDVLWSAHRAATGHKAIVEHSRAQQMCGFVGEA